MSEFLISEYCNSPAPENLSCNLLSKGNSVQNIVHDPVYPAGFADVNYVMSQAQKSSIPELGGLIERGLARMYESHVYELGRVQEAALSVIHPNDRRSGFDSLDIFTLKSVETVNAFLQSMREFVLSTVKSTNTVLTPVKVDELVSLVRDGLREDLYLRRFEGYESAFARRVARYGSTMKLSDFRADLSKATLRAGTSNRIRAYVRELEDALLTELERQRNTRASAIKKPQHPGDRQMSYSASTFSVMIASPGDVASERAIVRDVVYEWNAVNANSRKVVLLPVGWETHSSPEMGASAQTIINRQVLSKCDLLVGVFWTRIGTATERHLSGTVEEIEEHISAGKPAMLYFSSQPVVLDTVDMEQVRKLKAFKASCESRGLFETYDSHGEFKDKFYRQLQLKVNEHPLFQAANVGGDEQAIVESRTQLPALSPEARVLLKEASQDRGGTIIHAKYIGGTAIQTNEKNLIPSNERREVAKWEQALEELKAKDLVVDRGHKGEVFEITNLGYQVADMIAL